MSPRLIAKVLALSGFLALGAIVFMGVWVVRHHNAATLASTVKVDKGTLLHANTFQWTEMKEEGQQWKLTASEASYSEDKTSLKLTSPFLTMTAQDGKDVALRASQAHLQLNGNHVIRVDLGGGTEIHYGDITLVTDNLVFFPDSDAVHAPGKVLVTGAGFRITGIGMDAHPRAKSFLLNSEVHTVLTPVRRHDKPAEG